MTRMRAADRRGPKESCQGARPPTSWQGANEQRHRTLASWQGATFADASRWLPALLCLSRHMTRPNPGTIPGVSTRSGDKFPAAPPHPDRDERTSHPSAVVVLRCPCRETRLPASRQGAPSLAGAAASVPAAPVQAASGADRDRLAAGVRHGGWPS